MNLFFESEGLLFRPLTNNDLGKDTPATIWQIHERNPRDKQSGLTIVSFEDVTTRLSGADRSVGKLGTWLLAASVALFCLGVLFKRWNRVWAGHAD